MFDGPKEIELRMNFPGDNSSLDPDIVSSLEKMLTPGNALVGIIKQIRERYTASQ